MELYKTSLENRKFVTVCEVIHVNKSEPPPLFIIILSQKIIEAWIVKELISEE
jgi:hypothetical protein